MKDTYKGIDFLILKNHFGAWCSYVKIPTDHPWYHLVPNVEEVLGRGIDVSYNDIPLSVHGGLTFSAEVLDDGKFIKDFTPGHWVGWDYAHFGDMVPGAILFQDEGSTYYTEEMVYGDVLKAIDDMLDVKA